MTDSSTSQWEEVDAPYWRIDEHQTARLKLIPRLLLAVRPVIDLARRAAPKTCLLILCMQVVSAAAVATAILLVNSALSVILGGNEANAAIFAAMPTILALVAVYGVKLGADTITAYARAALGPITRRSAEERLFGATLQIPLALYEDPQFYDRLKRARDRGILHLEVSITALIDTMSAGLSVLAAGIALLAIHPVLLPVLLLSLIPGGWGAVAAARVQYEGMTKSITLMRHADMYKDLATQRTAAAEIRANQAGDFVLSQFSRVAAKLQDHLINLARREAKLKGLATFLSGIALILAFVLLGTMMVRGQIDLATAGTAIIAMRTASAALNQLVFAGNELFEKALYISDFQEFLDVSVEQIPKSEGRPAPAAPAEIRLCGVSFSYPGSARGHVLRDITLSIRAGETIAFVGENGSGKTTLAKLLAGLYVPTAGSISWDGLNIQEICPDSLRKRLSIVPQDPLRWPQTARINVKIGSIGTTDDRNERRFDDAVRLSGAREVAHSLPQGWDTLLSREFRGGQDLSSGQWQKLAVARGLYREAPIVIWDEPTAPLDAKAELAAYESLRSIAEGRTTILITHRLTSIRKVDRIYFLSRGRLTEAGSHDELIAKAGDYAELFALQSKLYEVAAL